MILISFLLLSDLSLLESYSLFLLNRGFRSHTPDTALLYWRSRCDLSNKLIILRVDFNTKVLDEEVILYLFLSYL